MRQLHLGILLCAVFSLPNLIVHEYPERHSSWYAAELPVPGMEASYIYSRVSKLIGENLLNISGVEQVFCEAAEGSALWLIRYSTGTDQISIHCETSRVLHQYRDTLPYQCGSPRLYQLPDERPVLLAYLSFTLENTHTLRLRCRELEERVLQLPGIRDVVFLGVPRKEIEVRLHPLHLQPLHLHPMRVVHFIEGFLFQFSLGVWSTAVQRTDIKASASIDSLQMLADLPIAVEGRPGNGFCPLSEIAGVQWARAVPAQRVQRGNGEGILLRISYDSRKPLYQQILSRYAVRRLLEDLPEKSRGIACCRIISAPSQNFHGSVLVLCSAFLVGMLLSCPEGSPLCITAAAGCNLTIHSIGRIPHTPVTSAGLALGLLLISLLPSTGSSRGKGFFRERLLTGILLIPPGLLLPVIAIPGSTGADYAFLRDLLNYPLAWLREAGMTFVFGILIESLYAGRRDGPLCTMPGADRNRGRGALECIIPAAAAAAILSLLCTTVSSPGSPVSLYAALPGAHSARLEQESRSLEKAVYLDYPGGPPHMDHMPLQSLLCRLCPRARFLYTASPAAAACPDGSSGYISLPLQYNPDEMSSFLEKILIPLQHHSVKHSYECVMREETAGASGVTRRELFQQLVFAAEGVPAGTLYHSGDQEYYPVRVTYEICGGISALPALPVFSADGYSRSLEECAALTRRIERSEYCCLIP